MTCLIYFAGDRSEKKRKDRKNQRKTKTEKDSNSTSSSISTAALEQIVEKLKYQSNRKSTDRVYYQIWKQFNQFFIRL